MNLARLEAEHIWDISFDTKNMKKQIDKEFKKLSSVDDYTEFICDLRARAWYWQEEDHPDEVLAKFYNKTWQALFGKVAQHLTTSEYMDFYYAVDPNP